MNRKFTVEDASKTVGQDLTRYWDGKESLNIFEVIGLRNRFPELDPNKILKIVCQKGILSDIESTLLKKPLMRKAKLMWASYPPAIGCREVVLWAVPPPNIPEDAPIFKDAPQAAYNALLAQILKYEDVPVESIGQTPLSNEDAQAFVPAFLVAKADLRPCHELCEAYQDVLKANELIEDIDPIEKRDPTLIPDIILNHLLYILESKTPAKSCEINPEVASLHVYWKGCWQVDMLDKDGVRVGYSHGLGLLSKDSTFQELEAAAAKVLGFYGGSYVISISRPPIKRRGLSYNPSLLREQEGLSDEPVLLRDWYGKPLDDKAIWIVWKNTSSPGGQSDVDVCTSVDIDQDFAVALIDPTGRVARDGYVLSFVPGAGAAPVFKMDTSRHGGVHLITRAYASEVRIGILKPFEQVSPAGYKLLMVPVVQGRGIDYNVLYHLITEEVVDADWVNNYLNNGEAQT